MRGSFTAAPIVDDTDESRRESRAAQLARRLGKQAADHNARVNDPENWPNHDRRGRGSR